MRSLQWYKRGAAYEETGGGSTGGGISQEEWDSWGPGFGSNDPNYPGQGV